MTLGYIHLPIGRPPPQLGGEPFRALVIVEQDVSNDWRNLVSDWLVASGCLSMSAWGQDCSLWDDSVDWANIAAFDPDEIPEDRFVMTTWHDHEPLAEAMWFVKYSAFHPIIELKAALIIDIAPAAREAAMLEMYRRTK